MALHKSGFADTTITAARNITRKKKVSKETKSRVNEKVRNTSKKTKQKTKQKKKKRGAKENEGVAIGMQE